MKTSQLPESFLATLTRQQGHVLSSCTPEVDDIQIFRQKIQSCQHQ